MKESALDGPGKPIIQDPIIRKIVEDDEPVVEPVKEEEKEEDL